MKTHNTRPPTRPPTRREFLRDTAALAGLCVMPAWLRASAMAARFPEGETGIFSTPNTRAKPRFMAHRGCHSLAPENSLPAFEEAGRRKFWAIETDARLTKDSQLVCHHDASLKRMFGVNERIANLSFDEIKTHTFTQGNARDTLPAASLRMPLFTEYLEICRKHGSVPFIEIKDDVTDAVIRVLRDMRMEERAVISSAKFAHIEEARKASKKVFVHHIFSGEEFMPKLAALGFAGLSHKRTELDEVSAALVEKTHKAGLRVCLRAGDTREDVLKMLDMGLDYIPTNKIIEM